MIGHIESYDEELQTGVIQYKAKFYEFHIDEWTSQTPPVSGDDVDFIPEDDGSASNVGPLGAYLQNMQPVKNHYIAGILGILFGAIGLHRLYLGFYSFTIAQIVLTYLTGGYGVVWGFVEGILLFGGQIKKDAKGRPLK